MTKVLLPTKDKNQAGARLLPGAVLEAVDFLELERPVEVKWSAGIRRLGAHRFRSGTHVITLSTFSDAKQVGRTLWHELGHAAQLEAYGNERDFSAAYASHGIRGEAYRRNPFEVQAREFGELNETDPLAA